MIHYKNELFDSRFDRGEALAFENIRLDGCTFSNCGLSLTTDIGKRALIRNVQIKDCAVNGCDIGPAQFENVSIDGLRTNDLLIIWGATFKHVTIAGQVGKVKLNPFVHHIDRSVATQGPFDEFRAETYDAIDWALDISQARFSEFDVRGIPARLFRLDPETQIVITRSRALNTDWLRHVSHDNTLWPFMIQMFLASGCDDLVLVAPLGAPKKKRDLLIKGLHELRLLGLTDNQHACE